MNSANAVGLTEIKDIAGILGTITTTLAVIFGGLWAYFKYVRGRTYRPRLAVTMLAQWRVIEGRQLLHARVIVKNIGVSVVTLQQLGTGLRVSVPAAQQPEPPTALAWDVVAVFDVLTEHQWIEAGETVSDDQLVDMDLVEPQTTLFETRLVWTWAGHGKEIVVLARQIFPPATAIGNESN